MKELTQEEVFAIAGGWHIRLHFNPFLFIGSAVGGFVMGGPVGLGIVVGSMLVAQGTGNIHEMAVNEFSNGR